MSKIAAATPATMSNKTKGQPTTTTCTSSQPAMVNKRRVRFCEPCKNTVHLPTERTLQCDDLFYSLHDLFQMKKEVYVAVHLLQQNMELPAHFSWRGLEYVKSGMLGVKQAERREFVRDFLSLQHELRRSHVLQQEDPLSLFVAARSKACRKDALKKAKQDEQEARKVYKQDKISSASWTGHNNGTTTTTSTSKRHNFVLSFVQGLMIVPSNRESSAARTAY